MLDHDFIVDLQPNGHYIIRQWRSSDGRLITVKGHESFYDKAEMLRRLAELRPHGDTYVRESPDLLRLVQP